MNRSEAIEGETLTPALRAAGRLVVAPSRALSALQCVARDENENEKGSETSMACGSSGEQLEEALGCECLWQTVQKKYCEDAATATVYVVRGYL